MSESQFIDATLKVAGYLWDSGILTAVAIFAVGFIKAHTKNKRLDSAVSMASQALASARATSTSQVREQAIQNLITTLTKNKYDKYFDEVRVSELIDEAIQNSVHTTVDK